MELEALRTLYEHEGPFATIYLESRSPAADAEQQVRLRWDDLRQQLSEAGTPEDVLAAIDDAVLVEDITEVHSNGRVLVANSTGVLLNDAVDASLGAGDHAHWSDEPELGDYIRQRERAVKMLVAITDQTGATIRQVIVADSHDMDERSETQIDADDAVSKPRENALHHSKIQNRADEVVKQNVREVAEHLEKTARSWQPEAVVVAGETQGRSALLEELSDELAIREVESGGTDDDAAEHELAAQLRAVAYELSAERVRENTERYEYGTAHDQAVSGSQAVARSTEMGAVGTLLLEYTRGATDEATHLAAAIRTGADVGLVEYSLDDAVAALLRFETGAETP